VSCVNSEDFGPVSLALIGGAIVTRQFEGRMHNIRYFV
jgi:hypothetical protein